MCVCVCVCVCARAHARTHMRERATGKREREAERDKWALKSERDNETKTETEKMTNKDYFRWLFLNIKHKSAVSNLMEKASFCKSRNLQCFQDPLWVCEQDSPEFLVKSLRAQFMLSIQGNVSSKQGIVFHIKEANRSQSINVIIHSRKGNGIYFLSS